MELHPIAIGAIVAAGITGLISLLGLIISKEQKTSEFRQQWIDSLREEVADLIGYTDAAIQHMRLLLAEEGSNDKQVATEKQFAKVKGEVLEAEKLYHKVLLRINPAEHVEFTDALEQLRNSLTINEFPSEDDLHQLEMRLISVSQMMLKDEWSRVKSGEFTFRLAKLGAVGLLCVSLGLGAYMVLSSSSVGLNPVSTAQENGG